MKLVRLPSPAMVVALGALVLSVGGNVTAALQITSADIKDETIRSVDIRNETIRSGDVGNETLRSVDVANNSLTGVDVGNETLRGVDVANNSLTGVDVVESSLGQVPSAAAASNAQNAGQLDGFDANSLVRVTGMGDDSSLELTADEQTYGAVFSLTAPRPGFVVVDGGITVLGNSCTTGCDAIALIRHNQSGFLSRPARESIAPGFQFASMPLSWIIRVNAGVNNFAIRVSRTMGNGTLTVVFGEFTAIYAPFGPTGDGPFATDDGN